MLTNEQIKDGFNKGFLTWITAIKLLCSYGMSQNEAKDYIAKVK